MVAIHSFFVGRLDNLGATLDGWLLESCPRPQLPQHARFLELLFEAFQGFVNRLVVFYVNNQHCVNFVF